MSLLPCDADGYAIPAADLLADWYIEHPDDPDEGDPADWPETPEIDGYVWELGPDLEPLPLTDQADLEDLRHWERLDPFDPLPPDEVDEIPF